MPLSLGPIEPSDRPIARLRVPQTVSECAQTLQLDTSGSTSNGVFPLETRITASPTTPNADALNEELSSVAAAQSRVACNPESGYCSGGTGLLSINASLILSTATFILEVHLYRSNRPTAFQRDCCYRG